MTVERTFSIIKPNAVANNDIGAIYARFERAGFKIIASKMLRLTREQAEASTPSTKVAHSSTA